MTERNTKNEKPTGRGSNQKPTFCFVMPFHISEGRGGGSEVQSWLLARELARQEYQVSYVAQSVRGKDGKCEEMEGVKMLWVPNAPFFRWANAPEYFRAMSTVDADIVVQRITSFTNGVVALWCKLHRRRFVWVCGDDRSATKWRFLTHQRELSDRRKVEFVKRGILMFKALMEDIARNWAMKQVAIAFVQNAKQEATLRNSFNIRARRIVSGHPLPKSQFSPESRWMERVVIWVGNLGPRKAPEKFIELAQLAEPYNFRFVLIGGRDDPEYIEQLFRNRPENLEWLGRLSLEEANEWFDRAAFFVNTSTYEGFPNTFIQAWLRGVPVLSLNVDPDKIISENKLGAVNSDLKVLLEIMCTLSSDKELYRLLSEKIETYAKRRFSLKQMTDSFLEAVL